LNSFNSKQQIACVECDLLLDEIRVPAGFKAHCPRCGHLLYHPVPYSVDKIFALSWTGMFLSLPAYLLPILKLDLLEDEQTVSLASGVVNLFKNGYWIVSLAILLTSIVLPLFKKLLLLYVSWFLKLRRRIKQPVRPPLRLADAFRYYYYLAEWSMLEVFMLGIMVSAIKLRDMGELHPGTGLYCFAAVLSVSILQTLYLDSRLFWTLIEKSSRV
jgi:paraquat-inducible protein A